VRPRIGIVGATGYTGGEIARLLLTHPDVDLVRVMSRSSAGRALGEAVPSLLGCTSLVLEPFEPGRLEGLDAVLLAVSHGAAASLVGPIASAGVPRIFDASADHRHAQGWVYGQPEWCEGAIRDARRVAVPGCFATAIALALAPLVAAGAVRGEVHVVAATGSTGSGAEPRPGTHHPERFANLKAYKVLEHQHVPEIRALLATLGEAPPLLFVPWSAPVDRGILTTCFVPVDRATDVRALFSAAYARRPLIRSRDETPELRHVRGSGFCDLSLHRRGDTAVILTAIDNLGKGAATQAVQCLNLSLGLPVDAGLLAAPCTP
jgi:N-acetyl-gamma-glutamyl-phosphate reductase